MRNIFYYIANVVSVSGIVFSYAIEPNVTITVDNAF